MLRIRPDPAVRAGGRNGRARHDARSHGVGEGRSRRFHTLGAGRNRDGEVRIEAQQSGQPLAVDAEAEALQVPAAVADHLGQLLQRSLRRRRTGVSAIAEDADRDRQVWRDPITGLGSLREQEAHHLQDRSEQPGVTMGRIPRHGSDPSDRHDLLQHLEPVGKGADTQVVVARAVSPERIDGQIDGPGGLLSMFQHGSRRIHQHDADGRVRLAHELGHVVEVRIEVFKRPELGLQMTLLPSLKRPVFIA